MQYEFQKTIVVVKSKKKYNQKIQGLQQHQWQQYICCFQTTNPICLFEHTSD
jgi:hypothetical protein